MNSLFIRKTTLEDLDIILKIYANAREVMHKNGNPHQWVNGHPTKEAIIKDINMGNSYVVLFNKEIVGVFSLIFGADPTYLKIYDGKWLNDEPYGTIHKIASSYKVKGILKAAIDYSFNYVNNIRIDTHEDNKVMRYLLNKYGFSYCGIIYLENGDPRLAYQKVKK